MSESLYDVALFAIVLILGRADLRSTRPEFTRYRRASPPSAVSERERVFSVKLRLVGRSVCDMDACHWRWVAPGAARDLERAQRDQARWDRSAQVALI